MLHRSVRAFDNGNFVLAQAVELINQAVTFAFELSDVGLPTLACQRENIRYIFCQADF
jgi:hypothetical protein